MSLVSMIVLAVPGFAATETVVSPTDTYTLSSPNYSSLSGDVLNDGSYSGNLYTAAFVDVPAGCYRVSGTALVSGYTELPMQVAVFTASGIKSFSFGEDFTVDEVVTIAVQSHNIEPILYRIDNDDLAPEGLYYSAYDILKDAFYGDVELTSAQDITLTMMATVAALLVIALPFVLVLCIISMLGRWR